MDAASELGRLFRRTWSLFLGNVVEWYEFAVYGYLETYLEGVFFQGSAIAAWLGFTVTFLARPLGGVILGRLGDVLGRRRVVNISIVAMLAATCGQGLLPTYASGTKTLGHVGIALLVCMRVVQGLSAAGEVSMLATYVIEVGSRKTLGRASAFLGITSTVGFLSAKAMVYCVESSLGEEAMRSWGWRVPFIFALFPGLVAVWGRRWIPETELFLEEQRRQAEAKKRIAKVDQRPSAEVVGGQEERSPALAPERGGSGAAASRPSRRGVVALYGCNVLIGICATASFSILTYASLFWTQSYLRKRGLSAGDCMLADLCARCVLILVGLPMGWLADIWGVGCVTFVGACSAALGGLPLFALLTAHTTDPAVAILVIGVCFATMGAASLVIYLFVAELFPTPVRGVAVGISYNVGLSLFGGLAPVLAEASLGISPYGPGFLMSLGGVITATTVVIGICLERRGLVQLAHVRPSPYFACLAARHEEAKGEVSADSERGSAIPA